MLLQQYQSVARRLANEDLFRHSWGRSLAALQTCMIATAIGWLLTNLNSGLTWSYVCGQIILAACFYQYFVIMHECGHNSFVGGRAGNLIIGSLVSPGCLIPFEVWARLHMLHHRWVGVVDMDPTQAHVLSQKAMSLPIKALFRVIWKARIPIPMIQFVALVFWAEPFKSVNRSGLRRFGASLLSIAVCVTPHLLLLYYLGWRSYAISMGPAIVVYFVIFELVNLPQHTGMFPYTSADHPQPIPLHEQEEITRTSSTSTWISRYLLLNFNLHSEHHLFPSAPWYSLPRIADVIRDASDVELNEVSLTGFNAQMRAQDPVALFLESMPGVPAAAGGDREPKANTQARGA